MTWGYRKLNDGRNLPEIGYGSWLIGSGQTVVDQVGQAIEVGFNHIDSAQTYRNEAECGKAIREADLSREDLWVTTKWSGSDNKGIRQSLNESLENLGLKSLDLYLIHSPRLSISDPLGCWAEFELIKKEGLSRSIGVSNFQIADLEKLREAGLTTPAVNQILLHPYVYAKTTPLLEYHRVHGIVTEAYSTLIPLTHETGGPVDKPLKTIGDKYGVSAAQVLFAWARSKGAVVVTTSSQKARLEDYLLAGDLVLSPEDIESIDVAGRQYRVWHTLKSNAGPWIMAAVLTFGVKNALRHLW